MQQRQAIYGVSNSYTDDKHMFYDSKKTKIEDTPHYQITSATQRCYDPRYPAKSLTPVVSNHERLDAE